jgi:hypothetical protein
MKLMRQFGQVMVVTLVWTVFLSFGCDGEGGGSDWAGSVETLPNGAVRVTNPAEGLWADGGQWTLTEELVLGRIDGPEEEVFSNLIGLEADDEGRIYVLDRDINQLRVFASDGTYLRSVGGPGEGPGEFSAANGLEWLPGDSLLVVDQRGNRYSIFSKEGEFARSVPRGLGFFAWAFRGGVAESRVYEISSVRDGDERHPAFLGVPVGSGETRETGDPTSSGGEESGQALSQAVDTILLPVSDAPPYESFSVRTDRGGMTMGVPFAPSSVYHLSNGVGSWKAGLWHGHGSEFRIFQSVLQGDTLLEIVVDSEPVPVSSQEITEFETSEAASRFREMGGDLDLGRIPEYKPFFDGLYRDPDGFLWVSIPSEPMTVSFAVIDPDGRYLGRLDLSGFERTTFVDPVVKNGRLHLVGRDDLGVQYVHVFRIDR